MSLEQVSRNVTFDGTLTKYKTTSKSLGGLEAHFNVFVPKRASDSSKVPVLYYLAGLTCNEDTAPWKGGFIRDAAQQGIALVFPDTSPRGANIEGEDKDWDFGTGAGFYLNATDDKYSKHYNMYDFITSELPSLLSSLPIDTQRSSIFGHSMGGHGALVLYLKTKGQYRSASAFAPIANPTKAPWGVRAFSGYLKGGVEEGQAYDATDLIAQAKGQDLHILVDVGTGDDFYKKKQLLPENFIEAAKEAGFSQEQVKVSLHEGYDHSYYFISTFAPDHVKFHAKFLKE
ncbi:BQ2448_2383 [Microbotryum intermedium]|uniref:S-formylglutathione hydrolase n=1 Tax=Microbotryum intermedium TaxID=269621 RepID=A0A238FBH9_9BASI|nr:BQ2448_2383 [Microbotryum intermedium]